MLRRSAGLFSFLLLPVGVIASSSVLGHAASVSAPDLKTPVAESMPQDKDARVHAAPRTDLNSKQAHAQLLQKARRGKIDIYFEGDSITRRWGCSDPQYQPLLANWTSNFFGWNAANFGWGGDTVQNILWRLENGELDQVNPKVIVLLAGTNNLGDTPANLAADAKVDEVTGGIRAVVDVMRQKAPRATILLTAITPRNDRGRGAALRPIITRINERIARFTDGRQIRYLNINHQLENEEGELLDGVTVDGLHLSLKGYQIWADALKPIFSELLGPPAATDLAPPPTGDPSLQKPQAVPLSGK